MTLDITKQVQYWNNGAAEDWSVAQDLLQMRHVRQALFFAHLTLEKMLKAYLTKKNGNDATSHSQFAAHGPGSSP